MKYAYIETYGCSANQNNSEIMAGLLKQSGFELTNNEDIADVVIINSCVVKGKTENKIKRRVQDIARIYPGKLSVITGCMPDTDAEHLKKLNPKILLLSNHQIKRITSLIADYYRNKLHSEKQDYYIAKQNEEKLLVPKIPLNKLISIVQISEGCLSKCTFCKTRLAKGALFSYDMEDIIKTVQNDLKNGAKEIWLTSQGNANYGMDRGKAELPELLEKILALKYDFKLRLGMMNPHHLYPITEELIEVYKNKKMYKFLHAPIQSGSDKVLREMKRPYNLEKVEHIINRFRKEFPDITIATDVIVGYPTETEEDFQKSLSFVERFKPDVFNLAKFSKHKGTEADELNELPIGIINRRNSEIMRLHRNTALENKKKFLNREIVVFVNKKQPEFYEARDDNYNIILLPNNNAANLLGKKVKVRINQVGAHYMLGEIVPIQNFQD
jgi:MiaB-like tRNA modifying enzyme